MIRPICCEVEVRCSSNRPSSVVSFLTSFFRTVGIASYKVNENHILAEEGSHGGGKGGFHGEGR